jgi:hypothetical protein
MYKGSSLVVVASLFAAACGSGDSGSESRDFATADLERLSFARDELPGLEYQRESSGAGAFSEDQKEQAQEDGGRSGLEFLNRLKQLGLEADHVSQFFATGRRSELSFVESITFLFDDPESAEEAITAVRRGVASNIEPAEKIDAPDRGEQPFGIRGEFDGSLTYSFGWRVGDAIQMLTVAPRDRDTGPESTLQLTQQLEAKAEE